MHVDADSLPSPGANLSMEEELHRAQSVERKCQVVGTARKEQQADRHSQAT
jgi:hypothetical protein